MDGLVKIRELMGITPNNLLTEAYKQADEINDLTTKIIQWFASNNAALINRVNKRGFELLYFNYDMVNLSQLVDPSHYTTIKPLIKRNPTIMFDNEMTSKGAWAGNLNMIKIYTFLPEFINFLKQAISVAQKDPVDETINSEDSIRILNNAIEASFRTTINHELRHAYDSTVSDAKYDTDKASLKFSADHDWSDPNSVMDQDVMGVYLTLPHEYWARFTATVNDIFPSDKPFDFLLRSFKFKLKGWDMLKQSAQQRLIKAFYKYYDLKKEQVTSGS